jgi:hypothetical protein
MTLPEGTADHVLANRASWDADADNWVDRGRISWAGEEITWGIWNVPERELRLLPEVGGLDAVELGCGTGYVSSWLSRRGARPVGLDNSARQLATARIFQSEFGIRFHWSTPTPSGRPSVTGASTWRSGSTGPRSGAIPTVGSPRRRGSCAPVGAGVPRSFVSLDADVAR